MSALARILKHRGLEVAGSDLRESATTRELVRSGIPVSLSQDQVGFGESDLIIYSSAIRPNQLELATARRLGKKVYHRAEILSSLLNQAKTSVAIAGSHGKTTTTSMVAYLLSELGKNPTCLVGGDILNLGTNTILGGPDLWVSEVDESDRTHQLYAPNYAVVTNLEEDHMDHYRDFEELRSSFDIFLSHLRNPGLVVYSGEDPALSPLIKGSGKPHVSFGFSEDFDFSANRIQATAYGSEFDLYESGFFVTRVRLSVPGRHNIANALAATALLVQLGLEPEAVALGIVRFRGARRRLEIKWESEDLMVIDDYAHHPTEVRASLRALRDMGRRLTVVFQPHRFSRSLHFFKEFGSAFEEADELILTEIYGAGEENPANIRVDSIYEKVLEHGQSAVKILAKEEISNYLMNRPNPQGIVAFLGAGDIGELADEFANRFKNAVKA